MTSHDQKSGRVRRLILGLTITLLASISSVIALPVLPAAAANETAVQVGAGFDHTCAASTINSINCWGDNTDHELGPNVFGNDSHTPVLADIADSVQAGGTHTCDMSFGQIRCWGNNAEGQLGDGTFSDSPSPTSVANLSGVISVATGGVHACAVLVNGTVECWGANYSDQLGNGSGIESSLPEPVPGVFSAIAVVAGEAHTCALISNGTAWCWGDNFFGQTGQSIEPEPSSPFPVSGLTGAVAIAAGSNHTCAVLNDGTAKCWGSNEGGQLGDNSTNDSSLPVTVSGLVGAASISGGYDHTCAMMLDGTARCWGSNSDGQLGHGISADSLTPVAVLGISAATSLSVGSAHSCAVLANGGIQCWGYNDSGQLGDGTYDSSLVPVEVIGFGGGVGPVPDGVITIEPCTIWNSNTATGAFTGPLNGNDSITLNTTGTMPVAQGGATNCTIPDGTNGILIDITALNPLRAGNLRAFPTGDPASGGVVNFSVQTPGLNNANAIIVPVSTAGELTVEVNAGPTGIGLPTTDIVVTAIGYLDPTGQPYNPVTPCAFTDSRTGTGPHAGPFTGTQTRTVQLTGTFPALQGGGQTDCGVPTTAKAALVNLVAVNPVGSGDIGVRPAGFGPTQTYVSYAQTTPSMNNSNAVVIPLSASGALALDSVAGVGDSSHVRAVVLGYFHNTLGDKYVPLSPCAAFDSRTNQNAAGIFAGPYDGGETRTMQITGSFTPTQGGGNSTCGVPAGATAVLLNTVAVNPLLPGNLQAFATGTVPTGGIVNFADLNPAMNNSNAVVVPLSTAGQINIFANGGVSGAGQPLADVRGVVLGYFIS